jgi:KUP system potassium uptake protein
MSLAALGVVYGDIGTSPLYTMREVFAGAQHALPVSHDNVMMILSCILWSLLIVVSLKYVCFIMRADNRGEGGIMALIALALGDTARDRRWHNIITILGILGAAMFYGDGAITPAISVLSAVEGIEIATPAFKGAVVPITIGVLFVLFFVQRGGTARMGTFFGPIMAIWFATIGVLGCLNIVRDPGVLLAVSPVYALEFFLTHGTYAFVILGAVVLCVTGAEALYADMGHFGRFPISVAWFALVLPALVLNYFGQGALLLADPSAIKSPFYLMAPGWALYPLVALSTVATVIASQAVISGAFSVTRQAILLGFVPRMDVQQMSAEERGQIYLPVVNWGLFLAVLVLVLGFRTSTNLAAAYGIAVTGDMVITSLLACLVAAHIWGWGWPRAAALFAVFLLVDLSFFSANVLKIPDGGWMPLVMGFFIFVVMSTWKRGREILYDRLRRDAMDLNVFISSMGDSGTLRVPGTAVFLTLNPMGVPHALLHNLKHNKVLHERVVFVTVTIQDIPRVAQSARVQVEPMALNFFRVRLHYGFMDPTDLPRDLALCEAQGLAFDMMDTSFFLSRETLIARLGSEMALWREKLFITLYRNAGSPTSYFRLPPNRVVEVGAQVVL